MTKPIAQTFIINEPEKGVDAVFLTKVDLFFQNKSDFDGVELQIRETVNGYPSSKIVPYGSVVLYPTAVTLSQDGTNATAFDFITPVLLRTNEQYALVVVPVGGNPYYNVWVGALNSVDISTKTPIYTNNQLGSLFVSSNDLNFTPIQNESMKYNLYVASFKYQSATAVFKNPAVDSFMINYNTGGFSRGEQLVVSNNVLNISSLTISGSNTFTSGEIVFQPGGNNAANLTQATAYGTVLFANTTAVVMGNTYGTFLSSDANNTVRGNSSNLVSSVPTFANQTVVTTSACNVITVPNANSALLTDFANGNYIYIATSTRSQTSVKQITAVSPASRTLTLNGPMEFTETDAIIGRVKADANLKGNFDTITPGYNGILSMYSVTSNASQNFASSEGQYLIGTASGSSAQINKIMNLKYESMTSQISNIYPNQSEIAWGFRGIDLNSNYDSSPIPIDNESPYEFIDTTRQLFSRSSEFANLSGNSSLSISATFNTANTKVSPYIDVVRRMATMTDNVICKTSDLAGYIISYSNTNGNFYEGDIIQQSNSTVTANATVFSCNTSTIYLVNVSSSNTSSIAKFNMSNSVIYNATRAVNSNITGVSIFSEIGGVSQKFASRYISKNVVLAEQQDAEDMVCYITGYRPIGTNFRVYGKFLAGADYDNLLNKHWSYMPELSDPALTSSLVNKDDFVELIYDLPTSQMVIGSNASVNTTSANVTVSSTSGFAAGNYVYVSANVTTSNTIGFNVRQVIAVPNSTVLVVSSNLSIVSANATVGVIPGLQSQFGAFRYANNNNIIRYTTPDDGIFETFKTFATKIVLVSNTSHVIPRMADMRCLALQI
jgi:hypothetical protein